MGVLFDMSLRPSFYGPEGPNHDMVGRATFMLAHHEITTQKEDAIEYSTKCPDYHQVLSKEEFETAQEWHQQFSYLNIFPDIFLSLSLSKCWQYHARRFHGASQEFWCCLQATKRTESRLEDH
jgi:hypothetical protein